MKSLTSNQHVLFSSLFYVIVIIISVEFVIIVITNKILSTSQIHLLVVRPPSADAF